MDKSDFIANVIELKNFDNDITKLEDILGTYIVDSFIHKMHEKYGELILNSAIPNASDEIIIEFWNDVVFGKEDISDFYERNVNNE